MGMHGRLQAKLQGSSANVALAPNRHYKPCGGCAKRPMTTFESCARPGGRAMPAPKPSCVCLGASA